MKPLNQIDPNDPHWERHALQTLLAQQFAEQRLNRRWRYISKALNLSILLLIIWGVFIAEWSGHTHKIGRHTAVVHLDGEIAAEAQSSAESVNTALQSAFADPNSVGIILRINSPGGSPVQAGMIHDEILHLRKKYPEKHIYTVVEEVCASGGYYVAVATEKIYVNQASVIGSIGVLMDGFGFSSLMEKLGIQRRLYTAGTNKGMLDPFLPENNQQRIYIQETLNEIHQQFITVVKNGRGNRLKDQDHPELFSGLFWNGAKSIQLGLSDELGSIESVARDVIKVEDVLDYTVHENFAERVARRFGTALGAGMTKTLIQNALPSIR